MRMPLRASAGRGCGPRDSDESHFFVRDIRFSVAPRLPNLL